MFVSQRVQYAARAVFELARHAGEGPLTSVEIALAQRMPHKFLNNILLQLRFNGIVSSVRGQRGGYTLGRAPKDVSVGDVLRAIEGSGYSGVGNDSAWPAADGAERSLVRVSQRAHTAMMAVYDSTTFQDLLDEEVACAGEGLDYEI